jgi:hypothetical protein
VVVSTFALLLRILSQASLGFVDARYSAAAVFRGHPRYARAGEKLPTVSDVVVIGGADEARTGMASEASGNEDAPPSGAVLSSPSPEKTAGA